MKRNNDPLFNPYQEGHITVTATGTACIPGISMQEPPLKVEPKELTLADIERLITEKHKEAQDERRQIYTLIIICAIILIIAMKCT